MKNVGFKQFSWLLDSGSCLLPVFEVFMKCKACGKEVVLKIG